MSDLIICPHCGKTIDTRHPDVIALPFATARFWERIKRPIKRGERMGTSEAGRLAMMTPNAAQYHLNMLVAIGLLKTETKRDGGVYEVYVSAK